MDHVARIIIIIIIVTFPITRWSITAYGRVVILLYDAERHGPLKEYVFCTLAECLRYPFGERVRGRRRRFEWNECQQHIDDPKSAQDADQEVERIS
jgi:hypothetical protein